MQAEYFDKKEGQALGYYPVPKQDLERALTTGTWKHVKPLITYLREKQDFGLIREIITGVPCCNVRTLLITLHRVDKRVWERVLEPEVRRLWHVKHIQFTESLFNKVDILVENPGGRV